MNKMRAFLIVGSILFFSQCVFAHDGNLGTYDIYDFSVVQAADHNDQPDWKGWATLILTNYTGDEWTDLHFQITEAWTGDDISTVDFRDDSLGGNDPVIVGHALDSWAIDNITVGATLDIYFSGDPILAGETVNINVWTDNTTSEVPWFGMCFQPTPEPTTIALLGLGGLALFRKRR
jgi:hypothetical protein